MLVSTSRLLNVFKQNSHALIQRSVLSGHLQRSEPIKPKKLTSLFRTSILRPYAITRPYKPTKTLRHYSDGPKTDENTGTNQNQGENAISMDYIPEGTTSIESLRKDDVTLSKRVKTIEISPEDPMYASSRYFGFPRSEIAPTDISQFSHMENAAFEYIKIASMSKTVHDMREYAQKARDELETLLQATGNHAVTSSVLFHLGLACEMLEDWSSVVEALAVALDMDPGLVPAKRHLADALQRLQRHPEAIHFYDEFYNDFPSYYGRLTDTNNEMTSETGEKVKVEGDAMFLDVVFARGRSYLALGEYGLISAKEDFKTVYRFNGKHKANSLYFLGLCEFQEKDYWKSIKYFDKALQVGPASWFMYKGRADAWRALGKEDRADDDERQAHILKRELHWAHKLGNSTKEQLPEFSMQSYISEDSFVLPGKQ